jgi:hypothetical protein
MTPVDRGESTLMSDLMGTPVVLSIIRTITKSRHAEHAGAPVCPEDHEFSGLMGGQVHGGSTNKNIFVKIIWMSEDALHETPERDVFY